MSFCTAYRNWLAFLAISVIPALTSTSHAQDKVTYDDHVKPIFRQHCLSCHSADSKKGDLAIDTYAGTMEGGASGEVVFADDLESSRLWMLITHEDEPKMPPESDKIAEDKLAVIRKWIEGGALENSGSVAKAKKKSGLAMLGEVNTGKPEGPAAMPESMFREPVIYSARAAAVTSLAASPWAPLFAVAGQRQVSLYHSETGALLGVIPFLERAPQQVSFSRDGSRLMVAGGRGAAIGLAALYDVKTGSRLVTAGDEYDSVLAADVNAKQTLVAMGGPQKIVRVYDAGDNSLVYEIRKHTDWITAIGFSPDGELLFTADRNGGMFLWEAETGREVASLRGHTGEVTSISWRADSAIAATSGLDGSVRLWEREEGKQVKSWTAHGGGASSVSFAADGRLVSAGRDKVVKLWKGDGGHIKDLTTFGDIALAVCISHDGKRVAAGDFSGEVRLIDIESGQQVAQLPPNPPTLAMRVSTTASHLKTSIGTLDGATVAKQKADEALAPVKAEADKRAAALADMQKKLADAKTAQGVATKDAEAKTQAAAVAGEQVKQAAAALTPAAAAVAAAESELSQARAAAADTAPAEAKLTAATEQTKQAVAGIETAQAALKVASEASKVAANTLAAANVAVAETEKGVQATQAAVTEYAPQLTTAQQNVANTTAELNKQKAAVEAATQAAVAAKAELEAFAAAADKFAAAIKAAEEKVTAEAKLLSEAMAVKEQAVGEVAKRKSAADEAAKKLAAVKAEYEKLKAAMDEAKKIEAEKSAATEAAELAQLKAEAAANQAKTDKELFEQTQAVRAEQQAK